MAQSNPNLTDIFSDVANSIRGKTGKSEPLSPVDFADEIDSIETGIPPVTGCVTDAFNVWPKSLYPSTSGATQSLSGYLRFTAINQTGTTQGIWIQGGVTSIDVNVLYLEKNGYKYYCVQNTDGAGKWRAPALFYGPFSSTTMQGNTYHLHYYYYDSGPGAIMEYDQYMAQQTVNTKKDTGPAILPGGTKWLITNIEKI